MRRPAAAAIAAAVAAATPVLTLAACARPTPAPALEDPEASLLAAERAIFAAFQHRDPDAMAALVAAEFVLRMPGQADVARADFLAAVARLPEGILSVDGEQLAARAL